MNHTSEYAMRLRHGHSVCVKGEEGRDSTVEREDGERYHCVTCTLYTHTHTIGD